LVSENAGNSLVSVSVYKRNEILPHAMLNGVVAETVFMTVAEQPGFRTIPPDGYMPTKVPDVAKRSLAWRIMYLMKVVNLLCHFFGHIPTALFIADEPESGTPGSVSVKIVDPVFQLFLVNKHGTGKIINP
jgi:hypothetical protein